MVRFILGRHNVIGNEQTSFMRFLKLLNRINTIRFTQSVGNRQNAALTVKNI